MLFPAPLLAEGPQSITRPRKPSASPLPDRQNFASTTSSCSAVVLPVTWSALCFICNRGSVLSFSDTQARARRGRWRWHRHNAAGGGDAHHSSIVPSEHQLTFLRHLTPRRQCCAGAGGGKWARRSGAARGAHRGVCGRPPAVGRRGARRCGARGRQPALRGRGTAGRQPAGVQSPKLAASCVAWLPWVSFLAWPPVASGLRFCGRGAAGRQLAGWYLMANPKQLLAKQWQCFGNICGHRSVARLANNRKMQTIFRCSLPAGGGCCRRCSWAAGRPSWRRTPGGGCWRSPPAAPSGCGTWPRCASRCRAPQHRCCRSRPREVREFGFYTATRVFCNR